MDVQIYNVLNSQPTLILALAIAVMLYILSKGADILVDNAVSLSIHWGVPKMIIGATIVSLGTTLPEATVSVLAALKGNPDLALGNAIGSIIADTGLIIGLAALLGTLPVDRIIVKRQGRIQLAAGFLLAIVCLPFLSRNNGNISQMVGLLFIALLIIYIYFSIRWTRNPLSINSPDPSHANNNTSSSVLVEEKGPLIVQIAKLFGGILLVIASSKILIPSVEITAVRIGIPQSIIAATLVALGTSLPELVTAISAVRKGHGELAVGNIVGADILNVLFVVGSAAAVTSGGLDVPIDFYKLQIPTMLIILFVFRIFTRGKNEKITKLEGSVLLSIYITYIVLNYTWL
ncbi:MAG: calcium/sodium antiporter [Clostridia bacterium]|nr:calcium/sodium antiporter [Clostridia bacterium]